MDLPPAPELTSAERKKLRGQAMNLKPAVLIGKAGVSKTVVDALNTALARDGLIKVRLEVKDKVTRKAWLAEAAELTRSTICGEVGHTASLYRPKPKVTNP
ncbi:MAG: YhbY family RNA-binding protein [Puniceicoccaceae bacterium]